MKDLQLPFAMAELRPHLPDLVGRGRERAPSFSVLLSARTGLQIGVDNREEEVAERSPSAGTVLSAFDGRTTYERGVGGFERASIERAARELVDGIDFEQFDAPSSLKRHGDFQTDMEVDPLDLSTREKLDRCRELQARARGSDSRVTNVRLRYDELTDYTVFAGNDADLAQRVQRVRLMMSVFVTGKDGQLRFDYASKGGTAGWEILTYSDDEIRELIDGALALLGAERIEAGEYQIITAPGVSGTICHESFGHGVETDMFLKERARAAHFVGRKVGSPLVNIYDDPSLSGEYGSYFFDDEGWGASPTRIVETGVFRRGISDRYSANALGIDRSSNGRRQDYSRKAYARMSNTYFGAGSSSLEEMLARVDRGVYLDKWTSGMEDPQGWGIQVTCHYGHEIRGGRITDRVFAPVGITGYVPEVLGSISAVGNRLELEAGYCGKGHKEVVPVAAGGPHLLMKARLG